VMHHTKQAICLISGSKIFSYAGRTRPVKHVGHRVRRGGAVMLEDVESEGRWGLDEMATAWGAQATLS
jgi:hypothetical protein